MTAPVSETGVILTEAAAAKAKALLEQEGRTDLSLRIAVQPGGCAGLRYQLYFDDRTLDGDKVDNVDGVNLVVDKMSVPYLTGAKIDFADTIESQASPSITRTLAAPAPAETPSTKASRASLKTYKRTATFPLNQGKAAVFSLPCNADALRLVAVTGVTGVAGVLEFVKLVEDGKPYADIRAYLFGSRKRRSLRSVAVCSACLGCDIDGGRVARRKVLVGGAVEPVNTAVGRADRGAEVVTVHAQLVRFPLQ